MVEEEDQTERDGGDDSHSWVALKIDQPSHGFSRKRFNAVHPALAASAGTPLENSPNQASRKKTTETCDSPHAVKSARFGEPRNRRCMACARRSPSASAGALAPRRVMQHVCSHRTQAMTCSQPWLRGGRNSRPYLSLTMKLGRSAVSAAHFSRPILHGCDFEHVVGQKERRDPVGDA